MKFELTIFIGKCLLYITFPFLFLFTAVICIIKMNPITILIGCFYFVMTVATPILAHDLLFKYADEIIKEREVKQ